MKNFNNPSDNKEKANLKRPLTLDLNKPPIAKLRFNQSLTAAPVLSSPDMLMLKLGSPELASMIMSDNNLQTPTPNLFPNKITTEQEDYAKGFEDALNNLHKNHSNTENQAPTTTGSTTTSQSENAMNSSNISNITSTNATMSGGGITYTNLDSELLQIKQEDSNLMGSRADSLSPEPSMEGLDPINMDHQERIKLERKRQRNRVAASKCRLRKIERISKLEDRVKILKVENSELGSVVMSLKQHVFQLKEEVISHVQSGCKINHLTNQF